MCSDLKKFVGLHTQTKNLKTEITIAEGPTNEKKIALEIGVFV